MAGGKLNIQGKVRASTILEVVISMIVIIVVFGIGLMIFSNVTRSSLSLKKLKAEAALQDRMLSLEQDTVPTSETKGNEDFRIEQKTERYNDNNHLFRVQLTAYDNNNSKVAELQKVIINP